MQARYITTQRVLLEIKPLMEQYHENGIVPFLEILDYLVTNTTAESMYEESIRQIIEMFLPDIALFEQLARKPNIYLFTNGHVLEQNQEAYQKVCIAFHEFAIGLFFKFHELGLVKSNIDLIFNSVRQQFLTVTAYVRADDVHDINPEGGALW